MQTGMEKIAFGSDVIISEFNSKARVPIIYGNNNSTSINIVIKNEAQTLGNTITFPLLENQVLSQDDYIYQDGLHIGDSIIGFSEEQSLAYSSLQDIVLYSGYTHIYSSDTNPVTMKIYYWSILERDNQVCVYDKYEQLITVFNVDDEETIINPRIEKTQNSEAIFTFQIDLHNPKWQEIKDPENLYKVDGMMFSTNFDTSFQETISENDEKIMKVTAYERQKLLDRKYVRAWNSETNLPKIDIFMVVVLSKGDKALLNDGNPVDSTHLQGTSGYALDALLYGTGWTTGICDVGLYGDDSEDSTETGGVKNKREFDLETDQLTVYENIMKVQELWGGILVFDSVNKIVHHRDETLWLPYEGYEVKYRKNMQSLEKTYNNKIITRLCPLGESNLNIKDAIIDDSGTKYGSEWIENFTYTNSILEGVESNPDITDPTQLKEWGERKLKDLCKPSKELTVDTVLLYQKEGYELETIDLNDVVDVINYNEVEGETEQLRVVRFEYGVWDKSDAVIELSDITLESTDIFRKTVSATNSINDGNLDASRVVIYYKNGKSVSEVIRENEEGVEKIKSDLTKSDDEIKAEITKIDLTIDKFTDDITNQKTTIASLSETIDGLKQEMQVMGGYNLLRNSVGHFDNEYWEGSIITDTATEIRLNNVSPRAIVLQGTTDEAGIIVQNLVDIKNGIYNISFNYKKLISTADVRVKISGVNRNESGAEQYVNLTETNWTVFERELNITDNHFRIEFYSNDNNSCWISDLILSAGSKRQVWSQNQNETMSDDVSIGKGITVKSSVLKTFSKMDADGNRIFNMNLDGTPKEVVCEMTPDGVKSKDLIIKNTATINTLFIGPVGDQTWITGLDK